MAPLKRLPEELKTNRITAMMTDTEVRELEDWMFKHRIRSMGEAIRVLIKMGIEDAR